MAVEQQPIRGTAESDDIEDSYPLSPMQQGMLFNTLASQQSGVDIEQVFFTIRSAINHSAFREAWDQAIRQHPILRSSFHWEGLDQPLQKVHRPGPLDLEEGDWRGLSDADQKERLKSYLQCDRQRGFDLTRTSPMRVALFQIRENHYHFIWTFHHALLDGRSLFKVLEQVHNTYESLCRNEPPRFQSARPYREHIEFLGRIDTEKAETFWRKTLEGFTAPTPLPSKNDSEPSLDNPHTHGEQEMLIPAHLSSSLKALASRCGVTLYTLAQAAWSLLLSRYSGEHEIVFGATRAGMPSTANGGESMMGLFINTLPIRVRVPDDMPLQSWLTEIRSQHVALREYEQTPLQLIQQWSEVASGRPLFESILVFENYDLKTLLQEHWNAWEILDFKLLEQTNYPLALSCWSGEELLLKLEYDRRRLDGGTVGRILGHLKTMLQGMLSYIDQPVSKLPMLTDAERLQVVGRNDTETLPPRAACVHHLFEALAASAPNEIAVIHEDGQQSYGELNERANQLAHQLRSVGVESETLVGISVERSLDMIVGLLAILKAGGAYVPLDPAYPKERLAAMLEDSGVPVLLTQRRLLEQLPKTEATVICLDSEWEVIARNSTENPSCLVKPESLAYVIYTSGSTGKPKGVMIEHRTLVNYIETASGEFAIEPGDRVLQFASISFDTSAEEIYACLARGATLVLRSDSMLSSVSTFLLECRDRHITVLDLPTAYWHELTASMDGERLSLPSSVRLVIIGGERALPERVKAWNKHVPPGVRLLNTYGPTEATIVATIHDLSQPAPLSGTNVDVPVGRPIANVRTYILDQHRQPAPIGVTGELCIGGAGLARGYLNRPELTREKFIPDPFSDKPGARLYRTGDLARYLPDGNLQLAGRVDDQVKINGFRIELGEIEAALRLNPILRDAIVVAREDRPGDRRLAAYVVPRQGADSFGAAALRDQLQSYLRKKLPRYMVPSVFVALDTLPISVNGKVDRKTLPPPDPFQVSADGNYARPRDPLEKHLVEIWEELLNVHPIGIRDNFFDLGGHSLLSVRMMDRVEQTFGKKLPLATLFDEATVEHLAALLLEVHRAQPRSEIVEIQKGGSKRPFFFLHGDFNGGGFYCLNLARGLGADQPFYAMQPSGLDGSPVPATIEEMADRHLKALRAFQPQGPYLLGGYCNGGAIAFEMARRLKSQGETIDLLVVLCASASNVRFKLLESIVTGLSNLRRLGTEERLRRFLVFRERLVRLSGIRDYYRSRLAELRRMKARERVTFFKKKAARSVTNAGGALASALLDGSSQGPQARLEAGQSDDRRQTVIKAYERALLGWVPKSYPGRVTLLWPGELPLDDPDDPTAGWSEVATEVDVHAVPGGHISCLTSNVRNLAETLRTCLEKTERATYS